MLETGKSYKTRGGWDAKVIWKTPDGYFYVVHELGTEKESHPVCHTKGGKLIGPFEIFYPPYEERDQDIIS